MSVPISLELEGLLELGKKKPPLKIFLKKEKTSLDKWQKEMVLGMCI
jgi:hypothetical protein